MPAPVFSSPPLDPDWRGVLQRPCACTDPSKVGRHRINPVIHNLLWANRFSERGASELYTRENGTGAKLVTGSSLWILLVGLGGWHGKGRWSDHCWGFGQIPHQLGAAGEPAGNIRFLWLGLRRWELSCQTQTSPSSPPLHRDREQSLPAFLDWWGFSWRWWWSSPPPVTLADMINILPTMLATTPKVGGYNPTPADRRSPLGWHRFLEVTSSATIVGIFWHLPNFRRASLPTHDAPLWATGSMLIPRAWRSRYWWSSRSWSSEESPQWSECSRLQFNVLRFSMTIQCVGIGACGKPHVLQMAREHQSQDQRYKNGHTITIITTITIFTTITRHH